MDPNNPNHKTYVNPKLRKIQEETQQMYEIFKKEVDVDTVMTQSEFEKYAPLYRKSTLPTDRNMTIDEVADLAELSQEYYQRINPQRPVHIVSDYGNEELFVLPPIFSRLRPLTGEQAGIIDVYSNVHEALAESNGPLVEAKKDSVDNMLLNDYTRAQDRAELAKGAEHFDKLAAELHKKVMGDNPFAKNDEGSSVTKEGAMANNTSNTKTAVDDEPDADFEF